MKSTIFALPLLLTSVSAFVTPIHKSLFLGVTQKEPCLSSLSMAGFGGAGSSKKGNKKGTSTPRLKPKPQWDKYLKLKNASSVKVAMRVANEGNEVGQWFEIGTIKSEENKFTEVAVALQKGIISEHAKRVYPLQFLPKDRVQWGYSTSKDSDADEWIALSEKVDVPAGIEKKIGFQGNADPSGYYSRVGSVGYEKTAAKKERGFN